MGIGEEMKRIGEDIVTSYDLRVKELGQLVGDVHKTLKGFGADRKKMSAEQTKALADFVADLSTNVGNMIKDFQKWHKTMADDLKESLTKGENERLKNFRSMRDNIQKGIKEIETYVKNKLKEFSDAHADMSEELKKSLAKYVDGIVAETKGLLGGFAGESKKMASNWQSLAATMAKKRGGKPVVSAGAEVETVEEAVEKFAKDKGKKRGRKKSKKG